MYRAHISGLEENKWVCSPIVSPVSLWRSGQKNRAFVRENRAFNWRKQQETEVRKHTALKENVGAKKNVWRPLLAFHTEKEGRRLEMRTEEVGKRQDRIELWLWHIQLYDHGYRIHSHRKADFRTFCLSVMASREKKISQPRVFYFYHTNRKRKRPCVLYFYHANRKRQRPCVFYFHRTKKKRQQPCVLYCAKKWENVSDHMFFMQLFYFYCTTREKTLATMFIWCHCFIFYPTKKITTFFFCRKKRRQLWVQLFFMQSSFFLC